MCKSWRAQLLRIHSSHFELKVKSSALWETVGDLSVCGPSLRMRKDWRTLRVFIGQMQASNFRSADLMERLGQCNNLLCQACRTW